MEKIRVGIIGQGRSGRDIHRHLFETQAPLRDRYEVVAIADYIGERCVALPGVAPSPELKIYTDYKELLKNRDIDLIINATCSKDHVALSIEALEAGFNVICEKPVARRVADFDRLVSVAAVCDLVKSKAEGLSLRYGIPHIFTDYRKMLDSSAIDAVSVCTDHGSHALISLDALAAGKHVICEKALSANRKDLGLMVAAESRYKDLVFSGVFQHRFESWYNYLRGIIKSGVFGRLLTINLNVLCWRSADYYAADEWRGTWSKEGGAVLINQAIHFIDLLGWMSGGVESISGSYANLTHLSIECEDVASASLIYKNGAVGALTATSSSPLEWEPVLSFNGTSGSLDLCNSEIRRINFRDKSLESQITREYAEIKQNDRELTLSKAYYGNGHPRQLANFISAIRREEELRVPVHSAAHAVDIVLSVYESYNTGKRITLTF